MIDSKLCFDSWMVLGVTLEATFLEHCGSLSGCRWGDHSSSAKVAPSNPALF